MSRAYRLPAPLPAGPGPGLPPIPAPLAVPVAAPATTSLTLALALGAARDDARDLLVAVVEMCPALRRLRLDQWPIASVQDGLATLKGGGSSPLQVFELHRPIISPADDLALLPLLPSTIELLVISAQTLRARSIIPVLGTMASQLDRAEALVEVQLAVPYEPLLWVTRPDLEAAIDAFGDACAARSIGFAVVPVCEA